MIKEVEFNGDEISIPQRIHLLQVLSLLSPPIVSKFTARFLCC